MNSYMIEINHILSLSPEMLTEDQKMMLKAHLETNYRTDQWLMQNARDRIENEEIRLKGILTSINLTKRMAYKYGVDIT